MTTIDDLINDYAMRAQDIYDNETAGQYTWSGLLGEFTQQLPAYDRDRVRIEVADWAIRLDDVYRRKVAGAYTFVGMLGEFARAIGARVEVAR